MKKAMILAMAVLLSATTLTACRRGKVPETTETTQETTRATTEHTTPSTTELPTTEATIFTDPSEDFTIDTIPGTTSEGTDSTSTTGMDGTTDSTATTSSNAKSGRSF